VHWVWPALHVAVIQAPLLQTEPAAQAVAVFQPVRVLLQVW